MKLIKLIHNPFVYRIRCWFNGFFWKVSYSEKMLIHDVDEKTAALWWGELNSWGWPEILLPKDSDKYIVGGRRSQMMRLIEDRLGMKYILRISNSDMTDSEFEDFWNMNHDLEARKRWEERVMRKYIRKNV